MIFEYSKRISISVIVLGMVYSWYIFVVFLNNFGSKILILLNQSEVKLEFDFSHPFLKHLKA